MNSPRRTSPRRALLSVSDKTGITDFARALHDRGFELLSTGGTARAIQEAGLSVTKVSEVTRHPEIMDGRVKTLHPAIHGPLLARREVAGDLAALEEHGYGLIDVVAVNLYPFRETVARGDVSVGDAMEQVDIGGPTMIRAAAKNHAHVLVVVDPADYPRVLAAVDAAAVTAPTAAPDAAPTAAPDAAPDASSAAGRAAEPTAGRAPKPATARAAEPAAGRAAEPAADSTFRRELAAKVFRHIAGYDQAVADFLEQGVPVARVCAEELLPAELSGSWTRQEVLRYGENPDQEAALYLPAGAPAGIAALEQLHGKALSYNNLLDLDGALLSLAPFAHSPRPAVVIVKHTTPCGVAVGDTVAVAYRKALATDPVSAFGSIIAVNRVVDAEAAGAIRDLFVECVTAPDFLPEALDILTEKKNLRILRFPDDARDAEGAARFLASHGRVPEPRVLRGIYGGVLAQTAPVLPFFGVEDDAWKVVTRRSPTNAEREDLAFAWAAVAGVKSNAILLARDGATLGIGAGQMSRVDSSRLAVWKAGEAGLDLAGCALASDAFFPFRDGVDAAAAAGVRAIIQPGGSVRDEEVIAAADEHGIAMILTGRRLFRH